jgi:hypothetical protein
MCVIVSSSVTRIDPDGQRRSAVAYRCLVHGCPVVKTQWGYEHRQSYIPGRVIVKLTGTGIV